jgi:hypothetical protein
MRHFPGAGQDALVIASYIDQYPGLCTANETRLYTIYIPGHGNVSWYKEDQLIPRPVFTREEKEIG